MQKLTARERRHKAVLNKIARLTMARNKGIKAIVAAETQLPALERQARRNELPVRPRKPKPVEHPKVVAKEMAIADALVEDKLVQRKRKVKSLAEFAEAVASPEGLELATDREARMKSMGFRKTSKRKGTQPSV